MRPISWLILLSFSLVLIDISPLQARPESVQNQCCCHSGVCHCHHAEGSACLMHSSEVSRSQAVSSENQGNPVFKALGCGAPGDKATNPMYSKDFYSYDDAMTNHFPIPGLFLTLATDEFASCFNLQLDKPPRALSF